MAEQHRGEWLIYGNFLKLFDFQIRSTPQKAAYLYGELQDLDRSLFTAFVSYILARTGFTPRFILELTGRYTTDFEDDDWIEDITAFAWSEELRELRESIGELAEPQLLREYLMWSHYYGNLKTKQIFKVIFVCRTDPELVVSRRTEGGWSIAYSVDTSVPNYIIVHPWTYKLAKKKVRKKFGELRENLAEKNVSLVSIDEFVHKFIPDDQRKYVVLENWISIRDRILENLHKDWQILIYASKTEQIAKINELFGSAQSMNGVLYLYGSCVLYCFFRFPDCLSRELS